LEWIGYTTQTATTGEREPLLMYRRQTDPKEGGWCHTTMDQHSSRDQRRLGKKIGCERAFLEQASEQQVQTKSVSDGEVLSATKRKKGRWEQTGVVRLRYGRGGVAREKANSDHQRAPLWDGLTRQSNLACTAYRALRQGKRSSKEQNTLKKELCPPAGIRQSGCHSGRTILGEKSLDSFNLATTRPCF